MIYSFVFSSLSLLSSSLSLLSFVSFKISDLLSDSEDFISSILTKDLILKSFPNSCGFSIKLNPHHVY